VKIKFNRAQLFAAFNIAASATPSRSPKDILRNVLMSVTKAGVELIATDQEIGVRVLVEGAETTSKGEALLPTAKILSILRELTDDTLEMEVDDTAIRVKAANGKFRLSSEDAREFPPVPVFTDVNFFRVAAPVFRQMVRRTEFATDTESTRYALGGLLMEFGPSKLTIVSTDSRRLSVASAACEKIGSPIDPTKSTVVPTKAMRMLERSADSKAEHIDIVVRDNDVTMRAGNVTVYSRLVEGRFPKYRDVIPKKSQHVIPVSVGPFFSAVRQSQIVTDEEHRGVDFVFNDNSLVIRSKASVGDSSIDLPIEFDSEKLAITFDPKYVCDFLKVCGPESLIELHLTDEDTAAVFRVDDSHTYVIMPLSPDR
jgi:DNA polymerase III subunit beta